MSSLAVVEVWMLVGVVLSLYRLESLSCLSAMAMIVEADGWSGSEVLEGGD